jgi:hypothetical protein
MLRAENATNHEPPCRECSRQLCTHHTVAGLYTLTPPDP